jgi:hypothetical protein
VSHPLLDPLQLLELGTEQAMQCGSARGLDSENAE